MISSPEQRGGGVGSTLCVPARAGVPSGSTCGCRDVSQTVALALPWHLVLILSGTMKGEAPGETGDTDVADGELGEDGEVGPLSCH